MSFKNLLVYFCFFYSVSLFSQDLDLKGIVVNADNHPIANCIVFIKNTLQQTQTDSLGRFVLKGKKNQTIFIQKKGFEIYKDKINKTEFEVSLKPIRENNLLHEDPQDYYALFLISQIALQHEQVDVNTSIDYFSKGKIELTSERERFLGQKRKDIDPSLDLDSVSNLIYLSELSSKLTTHNMNNVHENVISVQERGKNKDILFQTGTDSNFNFYDKKVSHQLNLISPIFKNADLYYYYKLKHISSDSDGYLYYTISFYPKRDMEPICEGELTFSTKNYQLLYIKASMLGRNVDLKEITRLNVIQNFSFNEDINRNVKLNQKIELEGRFIVFDFAGEFESIYSNHKIIPSVAKQRVTKELITYDTNFDNRRQNFYQKNRILPFSTREQAFISYKSPLINENTRVLLDSIDKRTNNFTVFKLIKGHQHINSFENTIYSYRGLLSTFAFNAVQGFNVTTGLDYVKTYDDNQQSKIGLIVNYGLSEDKFRFSGYISHIFNQQNYNELTLSGGSTILQFNQDAPIKTPINSFASAWFGKNYAKFFEKKYMKIDYSQYMFNGVHFNISTEFAQRETLKNSVLAPPFVPSLSFESNNPLDPTNYNDEPFIDNIIFKLNMNFDIVFDQKIINYPNKRQYIQTSRFPVLSFFLEKGLSSTTSNYNYTFASISTKYSNNIGNIGNLFVGLSIGNFFEKNDIAFTDYKHFNGNQTFIGSSPIYNKQFNLLPYYQYSTKDSYVEFHAEHDFRGFLANKIPLLNKTRYSIIIGFHSLSIPEKTTHREYSIGLNNFGFGKFRPFRIDYFRALSGESPHKQGIILGIKVLDLIQK